VIVPPLRVDGAAHVNGMLDVVAVPATKLRGTVVIPDSVDFDTADVDAL
jgi:hypothetical protein